MIELLTVIAIIAILACLLLAVISGARGRAAQVVCLNNLRQIALGVRLYSDDANDKAPKPPTAVSNPYDAYKELMKSYVGLHGKSSVQDRLFACPADIFYFDYLFPKSHSHSAPLVGYVPESLCARADFDFSSYVFNAGGKFGPTNRPGIAGLPLSSVKHPARTVLVTEAPAVVPFSWHKPKHPLYLLSTGYCPNLIFNNARNMASFVDGHVSLTRFYWNGGFGPLAVACNYDPPDGYDYQWSPN